MPDLRPNYKLIELTSRGSDRQVDPQLAEMLRELARQPSVVDLLATIGNGDGKPWEGEVARVRRGLHKALDFAVHGSLASGFVIQVLNIEWERLGGRRDDPAPWREEFDA